MAVGEEEDIYIYTPRGCSHHFSGWKNRLSFKDVSHISRGPDEADRSLSMGLSNFSLRSAAAAAKEGGLAFLLIVLG